ncbi:MAG: OadG family protein [Holophagales bacterium]|nr:OadG family protein [Holophagales bacterium]
MSQWEAWTVTALGMAVVFIGLVACIAFIQLFSRVSRNIRWGEEGHGHGTAPAPVPAPAAPDLAPSEPVPADVLAVITAVLQVERKLYLNRPGSRVTIRRSTPLS